MPLFLVGGSSFYGSSFLVGGSLFYGLHFLEGEYEVEIGKK